MDGDESVNTMATTPPNHDQPRPGPRRTGPDERPISSQTVDDAPEPLRLLQDDYASEILTILAAGPRHGRELAELCGVSRATIYRRLNRLEAAGFLTAQMSPDPDGHHRQTFHLLRDRLTVTVEDGSIAVTVRSSEENSGRLEAARTEER